MGLNCETWWTTAPYGLRQQRTALAAPRGVGRDDIDGAGRWGHTLLHFRRIGHNKPNPQPPINRGRLPLCMTGGPFNQEAGSVSGTCRVGTCMVSKKKTEEICTGKSWLRRAGSDLERGKKERKNRCRGPLRWGKSGVEMVRSRRCCTQDIILLFVIFDMWVHDSVGSACHARVWVGSG